MARNIIPILLAALTLVSIDPAQAQQQSKIARIGWLSTRPVSRSSGGSDVIRRELHQLGYAEGKNIVFEYRYTEGNLDRLPALADELVRLKVDVLLAYSTPDALAPRTLPGPSPSFLLARVILLRLGWWTALHGPEETSRGSPRFLL